MIEKQSKYIVPKSVSKTDFTIDRKVSPTARYNQNYYSGEVLMKSQRTTDEKPADISNRAGNTVLKTLIEEDPAMEQHIISPP